MITVRYHLLPSWLLVQTFKARVLVAYDRRCAITGSKIRPVLQAVHIRPVTDGWLGSVGKRGPANV